MYDVFGTGTPLNISHIYSKAHNAIHPVTHSFLCTALFLNNFADTEWINIECDEPASTTILCSFQTNVTRQVSQSDASDDDIYNHSCIMVRGACFLFAHSSNIPAKQVKQALVFKTNRVWLRQMNILVMLRAVRTELPPFVLFQQKRSVKLEKVHNSFVNRYLRTEGGMLLFPLKPTKFVGGGNIANYFDGYVSIQQHCSVQHFSPNQSKHEWCNKFFHTEKPLSQPQRSFQKQHIDTHHRHQSQTQTNLSVPTGNCCERSVFHCGGAKAISSCLLNDLVVDCGEMAEDEHLLQHIILPSSIQCIIPGQIPCRKGHPRCFSVSDTCRYHLNSQSVLSFCRTGEHLENCVLFSCNMMFKCPSFYCIPWSYVCDGKLDCPFGQDEDLQSSCKGEERCRSKFRCLESDVCIHLGDVCDTKMDCPLDDDEQYCTLHQVNCPPFCECFIFTARCSVASHSLDHQQYDLPFRMVYIHNCLVHSCEIFIKSFKSIVFLSVHHGTLTSVCSDVFVLRDVSHIDAGHNQIKIVKKNCFPNSAFLKVLNLTWNQISAVHQGAFSSSPLEMLDLSHNPLNALDGTFLQESTNLKYFVLKGIFRKDLLESSDLGPSQVQFLHVDCPQWCCFTSSLTVCVSVTQQTTSCASLLPHLLFKVSIGLVTVLIFWLNLLTSIFDWFQLRKRKNVFYLTAAATNVVFLIHTAGLLTLWVVDSVYGDKFVLQKDQWVRSYQCIFTFTVFLFVHFLSPLLLAFFSLERTMVVLRPMETKFLDYNFVSQKLIVLYSVCSCFCICAGIFLKIFLENTLSEVCFPFYFTATNSAHIFVFLEILLCLAVFLFNCVSHRVVHATINESKKIKSKFGKTLSTTSFLIQMIFLLGSQMLSWFPSSVVYLVILFTNTSRPSLMIFTIIYVTTLPSLVTPLVYFAAGLTRK